MLWKDSSHSCQFQSRARSLGISGAYKCDLNLLTPAPVRLHSDRGRRPARRLTRPADPPCRTHAPSIPGLPRGPHEACLFSEHVFQSGTSIFISCPQTKTDHILYELISCDLLLREKYFLVVLVKVWAQGTRIVSFQPLNEPCGGKKVLKIFLQFSV